MSKKRCAFVAAVLVAVCAVVFLCWNGPSDGAEKSVSDEGSSTLVTAASSAVAAVSPTPVQASSNQTATVRGTRPYVLTCEENFDKPLRLAVESMGARSVGLLSRKSLLIEASASTVSRIKADGRFTVERELMSSDKIAPELAEKIAGGAKSVDVSVVTLSPADHRLVQNRVVARGGEILTGCFNAGTTFKARMSASLVSELASFGDVRWMEVFVRPHFMNDVAVEPQAMNVRPAWDVLGLSGAGQYVSTSDSGIDLSHLDLTNQVPVHKVVDGCADKDVQGHGTHTAGSIAGDGTMSDGLIRGTAWGAKLYAWFCGNEEIPEGVFTPETIAELFRGDPEGTAWTNAHIHSASWGSDASGRYTTECADIDQYVWEHPDFLPVFSAGNSGFNGTRTIGSPASAKNVLAVGATANLRTEPPQIVPGSDTEPDLVLTNGDPTVTAEYSSRGPCGDGRIKPDVAAPGTGVLSTRAAGMDYLYGIYDDYYAYDTGTSMACPLTAGAVALIREWLMRDQGFTEEEPPSAALMKAVITGGAKDAEKPNNDQGWGRVDLLETIAPSNRAVKLIDRIPFANGEDFIWIVETTNAAPLDVQLAWIDYPGNAGGNTQKIVNDLNLTVRAVSGGETYYGNGGSSADTLNTLESVRLGEAQATKYYITVSCPIVLHDYREGGAAALYIRGAFNPKNVQPYWTVRVVRSPSETYNYLRLDKALRAAQDGDVLEILDKVDLYRNVVLTNAFSLTVVATNANPYATPIVRRDGADILVRNGSLFFTNTVFQTEPSTPVKSADTGVIKVAGTAVFDDIVSRTPGIAVASYQGFELAGRIKNGITIECAGASTPGKLFGTYSCAYEVAAESAPRLISTYGVDRAGVARDDGFLAWEDGVPVDPAVAVSYVDGNEPVHYYRTLDRLFEDHPSGTNVVITKSGISLSRPVVICGATSIVTAPDLDMALISPSSTAGFLLGAGAELTVSSVTLRGYRGNALFQLAAADARLVLTNSVLDDIEGTNAWSGAVCVGAGRAEIIDSVLTNCRATGKYSASKSVKSYGGGAYLAGQGAELVLDGATISDCSAVNMGGGVYVKPDAVVRVRGLTTVRDNVSVRGVDDVCLDNGTARLELAGELPTGSSIGVRVGTPSGGFGPMEGNKFATIGAGGQAAVDVSKWAFFNDANQGLVAVADGEFLKWAEPQPTDSRLEPFDPRAVAWVVAGGTTSVTDGYATVEQAFAAAKDNSRILLRQDAEFSESVESTASGVTLSSAGQDLYTLTRRGNVSIVVSDTGTLTVTNLTLSGGNGTAGLIHVNGGALTLEDGATVCDVTGSGDRAVGGVIVWNHGTLTLKSGSSIANCRNDYVNPDSKAGYGGGVLADESTVYLLGGTVTGCVANRGGGVFIGNGSTVYVANDCSVSGNRNRVGASDNLCVSDDSHLYLTGAGPLTGSFGYNEGKAADASVFGLVAADFGGTAEDAQVSAHRFRHDVTGDTGMAVTNAEDTLLVWGAALERDGTFTRDGKSYALVDGEKAVASRPIVRNFTYDGTAKTGVEEDLGYMIVGGTPVATDAGTYEVTIAARPGYVLAGSDTVTWRIDKAAYRLTGITFKDQEIPYDGQMHWIEISGTLPDWLTVTYENNGQFAPAAGWKDPGVYEVTATITGSTANYKLVPDPTVLVATLTILPPEEEDQPDDPPTPPTPPPGPTPEPHWVVETYHPTPIAFKSIDRVSDTEWALVITNRVKYCNYRLLSTKDLTQGFTSTGDWEHAVGDASDPVWTTNVITTGGAWFWRAEGKDGTNMVLKTEE